MRQHYGYGNQDCNMFDDDYIAMLSILSTVLQVYNIDQAEKQSKDNVYLLEIGDKLLEKFEKLEGKIKRLERMMERSAFNGR